MIGGIALSTVNFFRNLSIENVKVKKENSKEFDSMIFSRMNLDVEAKPMTKKDSKFDEIRDSLLKYLFNKRVTFTLLLFGILIGSLAGVELFGIYLVVIVMCYVLILYYPQIKKERSYSDLNQELPYALRHMGIGC